MLHRNNKGIEYEYNLLSMIKCKNDALHGDTQSYV